MQYIAYAQRGTLAACAEESFDCVMCGVCSAVARRAFPTPRWPCWPADQRQVSDAQVPAPGGPGGGGCRRDLPGADGIPMGKPLEELQKLYNHRGH